MVPLFFYKLLLTLITPFLCLGLFIRSIKQRSYRQRILERFGLAQVERSGGIVIHGASVGEVIALRPFIEALLIQYPQHLITVTTFTPTGSEQVKKSFGSRVQHCYLPFDTPYSVALFLNKLKPLAIVIMETEIWPSLIDACNTRKIKLLLINARISARSFTRYQKIQSLITGTLCKVDNILAQSKEDAERFIQLGALADSTSVSGNLKYDLVKPEDIEDKAIEIVNATKNRKVWVIGSSHQDEEALILSSLKVIHRKHPDILCILAPRHPERIKPLELSIQTEGLSVVKRSQGQLPSEQHNIWLIDTMGELLLFYRIADVCTVAGSFGATGGHNPLEPALFSCPIIVGPNMSNFQDIAQRLEQANGWLQVDDSNAETLANAVTKMVSDPDHAQQLGENALTVLKQNQGATKTSVDKLDQLLYRL
ncbi:lipid IV(A) 3-deoxy-D-manno-octulosonic acid transferase [Agarilytica rhodophyticola]|uniref:lipid IV(A) 3-deoxy-D-manno-octulosonic acid transferase n=1 Tax=Agarilytica rhodophyticola TaxID=1737490 RepID=UPI000B3484C2|nr:lipid IV(A) 3-deoxy-D-manno-octulosonic acid transferase [Agarilytica rhodophyticola]